jgi:hypothetical protein
LAALSGITAVRPTNNTTFASLPRYGATISAGQSVYQDSADSKWKPADANASATTAAAKGIAVTPGVDGGYGIVATGGGVILVGATMVVGTTYNVGSVTGSIVPNADLATGDYVTTLGVASTSTQLDLSIKATGIVKP